MPDERDVAQDKRALEQNEREGTTAEMEGSILNTRRSRDRKRRRKIWLIKTLLMKAAIQLTTTEKMKTTPSSFHIE